jgi:hypothetical protein
MDERVRFVGRLLDGEKMVALCREFAISRKTGYKIFDRYKEYGLEAPAFAIPTATDHVLGQGKFSMGALMGLSVEDASG